MMGRIKEKSRTILSSAFIPCVIFAVVWYVSSHVLRYTMLMQEQKGIFLNTPDYYRQLFADSWPIATLISDFLVQFYRVPGVGAAISALIVTLAYIGACRLLRFLPLNKILGTVAGAASWIAIAHANTPRTGVFILFASMLALLVSTFIPYDKITVKLPLKDKFKAAMEGICVALIVVAGVLVVRNEKIRENERWYAVEYLTRVHDWSTVLAIATPQLCKSDMSYVPYALLALNASGQLGERLFDYPITGPESFGETAGDNWSAFSLRSVIYETIGCPNEAIHQAFQLGMALPHGTSFGILRQLIRLEIEKGDYQLAIKHAEILGRSPFNKKTAQAARKMAIESSRSGSEVADDKGRESDTMISNSSRYNLSGILLNCKDANSAAADRLLAHFLIIGDMDSFRKTISEFYGAIDPGRLPKYFRQAITQGTIQPIAKPESSQSVLTPGQS
ncbi:MAG: DUF6057 family protein [Bacteroidales bacterium]|nr:DUF6057 family protein [Bacteroidales bacterium]